MKITSVLFVDSIEEALPFWVERMGWEKTVEVPDGERLGFVILVRDGSELMLQTFRSVENDVPQFIAGPDFHRSFLFIEVEDWSDVLARLEGYEIAMTERVTLYGMREVGVFAPGGHAIIFAAKVATKAL